MGSDNKYSLSQQALISCLLSLWYCVSDKIRYCLLDKIVFVQREMVSPEEARIPVELKSNNPKKWTLKRWVHTLAVMVSIA